MAGANEFEAAERTKAFHMPVYACLCIVPAGIRSRLHLNHETVMSTCVYSVVLMSLTAEPVQVRKREDAPAPAPRSEVMALSRPIPP